MKNESKDVAWKVLVYSALAVARVKEATDQWKKHREQQKVEDKLRRNIQSVWDALG